MSNPEVSSAESSDSKELFNSAWETLKSLQMAVDEGLDPLLLQDDLEAVCKTLKEYLDDRKIFINSPVVFSPALFENPTSLNAQVTEGSQGGMLHSIIVMPSPLPEENERRLICVRLNLGKATIDSATVSGKLNLHAVFPISEASVVYIEEAPALILPEHDDETASEIDALMLNEQIDLAGLDSLFSSKGESWNLYEQEMYLNHLNSLASFGRVIAMSERQLYFHEDSEVGSAEYLGEPTMLEGDFSGFKFFQTTDGEYLLVLCAVNADEEVIGMVTREIEDIQLFYAP